MPAVSNIVITNLGTMNMQRKLSISVTGQIGTPHPGRKSRSLSNDDVVS